jgi:hypothetical protein
MPQSRLRILAVLPVAKQNAISAGTSPTTAITMRRIPSGCTPEPAGPAQNPGMARASPIEIMVRA